MDVILILANHSADIFASTPTVKMALIQQFGCDMQMKTAKNKPQVEITTNDPTFSPFPFLSMHGVTVHNLYLSGFNPHILGHFSSPIFHVSFATLPISSLSGPNGSVFLHLSFQFPSLIHPVILLLSLSQLALGLRPGGLFALEDHDGLYHSLHQCWGTAM